MMRINYFQEEKKTGNDSWATSESVGSAPLFRARFINTSMNDGVSNHSYNFTLLCNSYIVSEVRLDFERGELNLKLFFKS